MAKNVSVVSVKCTHEEVIDFLKAEHTRKVNKWFAMLGEVVKEKTGRKLTRCTLYLMIRNGQLESISPEIEKLKKAIIDGDIVL